MPPSTVWPAVCTVWGALASGLELCHSGLTGRLSVAAHLAPWVFAERTNE